MSFSGFFTILASFLSRIFFKWRKKRKCKTFPAHQPHRWFKVSMSEMKSSRPKSMLYLVGPDHFLKLLYWDIGLDLEIMRQILACDHSTNYWQSGLGDGALWQLWPVNNILWSSPQWETLLHQAPNRWKVATLGLPERSEADSLLGKV